MDLEKYEERKKWFLERIGRKIYRGKISCPCEVCKHVGNNGLIIVDESHALYLNDIEAMYNDEGHLLKYVDSVEEVQKS